MKTNHHDLKELDKRITIEGAKAKTLASGFEKVKKAIELEKKTYSTDFKKGIDQYAENIHLPPEFKKILTEYSSSLEKIAPVYDTSCKHIQNVSCNALGFLPKKYDNHKKSLKLADKVPESVHKIKDFEFDRILYTQQALLHYFNAQMLLHAKQFEMYANLFERLEEHNEAQDMAIGKYQNADWVIKELKSKGLNVSK
ncbi:hypothetical protein FGO68_gene337 [Halteria grandinella]|uniref:Uncharacterized protein n=1 Tax=Halteria grandinella TaxID=5974 RepID=A0A8J8NFC5_HALGN|nr:hypothetical protein FGO68_gene337 [Halteria grandinella]